MQGVIGLLLLVIGGVLLYDVIAGKSQAIVSLINGTTDIFKPVGSGQTPQQFSPVQQTGTGSGSGSGTFTGVTNTGIKYE